MIFWSEYAALNVYVAFNALYKKLDDLVKLWGSAFPIQFLHNTCIYSCARSDNLRVNVYSNNGKYSTNVYVWYTRLHQYALPGLKRRRVENNVEMQFSTWRRSNLYVVLRTDIQRSTLNLPTW